MMNITRNIDQQHDPKENPFVGLLVVVGLGNVARV